MSQIGNLSFLDAGSSADLWQGFARAVPPLRRSPIGEATFQGSDSSRERGSRSSPVALEALLIGDAFGVALRAPVLEPVEKPMQEPHQMSSKLITIDLV